MILHYKSNIFFWGSFYLFSKWPSSTRAENSRHVFLQNIVRYPLYPSLVVFLSSVRFLLNVHRVRFVFRMRNASPYANPFFQPRKKCWRAGTTSAKRWVNMNEFLRNSPYVNKKKGVVDKNPLRCYIKFILQILKVLLTKPYKRLWKKNQTRFGGSFFT